MRAICFIQEVKSGDLTMRQQILICRKALRKLRWSCVQEVYAQAGTEDQPLSLRPGMADLLRAAADGEADVLIVVDAEDALLICDKDSAGNIKKVLENLKICGRTEYL